MRPTLSALGTRLPRQRCGTCRGGSTGRCWRGSDRRAAREKTADTGTALYLPLAGRVPALYPLPDPGLALLELLRLPGPDSASLGGAWKLHSAPDGPGLLPPGPGEH